MKGHPVKQIHWKYRVEMENRKNDKGYESDGGDSNTSVKTVKSQSENDNLDELPLPSQGHEISRSTTGPCSMQSSVQVRRVNIHEM